MAQLGEFGAELAVVDDDGEGPDTFLFHGHEFALPERVSSLPALRFAYNAQQVVAMEGRATAARQRARTDRQREEAGRLLGEVELVANAGLYAYLRDMLPGGQWERFEEVAAENGVHEEELLDVAQKIMAAVAARPTQRSNGSPVGPSPTGVTSLDASPSPPTSQPPAPQPPAPRDPYEPGRMVAVAGPRMGLPEPPEETVTALERARAEILDGSVSVHDLVRSGR